MKKAITEYRKGRTCVFNMHVHLVFVAKYRHNIFTGRVIHELKKIFSKVYKDFESELIECNGEKDHVHLLVNYPPKYSIRSLVNSLKRSLFKNGQEKQLSRSHEVFMGKTLLVILLLHVGGAPISTIWECFDLKDYLLSIHPSETEIFCKPFAINTM